ncbi:ATP-binding protein [Geothrix limicola]|nr:ATP-binding protein [Geothrix limicola]
MSDPDPACKRAGAASAGLSVERMRALLSYSWDILSLLDGQGRLIYNSPAAQRLHGFDPAEMEGRSTFEFFHPDDAPGVAEVFESCLAQPGLPVCVQYRYARKDGSWIWMEAVAVNMLDNPSIRAIVVNSRDISERKYHERELERMNRLYGMLSHLGHTLVRVQNREGLFQEICNMAVEKGGFRLAWIGWTDPVSQQVIPVAKAGPGLGYLEGLSVWADARAEGMGPTGRCIRENRSYICQDFLEDPATAPWRDKAAAFNLHASASVPIRFQGQAAGALMVYSSEAGVFQDQDVALLEEASAQISFGLEHLASEDQRRVLESELFQVQKMESLGSLAGGVAHDMNNVLGSILAMASMHQELQPPETPAHQAFSVIVHACDRGASLLRRLLDFARRDLSDIQVVHLNALIQEEVLLLERTTLGQIRLAMDLDSALPAIRGDASALLHAIMNLCINAVDAMPSGGCLTLRTRTTPGGWAELEVEDSGHGMSKEVMEKALDPFFTTKPTGKGTGLGLSIVYSTVNAHHGIMELRSEVGVGTRVILRFPAAEAIEDGQCISAEPAPGEPTPSLDVVLVDDDPLIRDTLASVIQCLGHRVTPLDSGEAALAWLASDRVAEVLILDMNMPGLGGGGTLPYLRDLRPELPVLLATGRVDQTALDLVQAFPHVKLLPKPFSMNELKARLEALVAQTHS